MRLLRLTLKNFRQFQGEQTLDFAGDSTQNVTVIYGQNGAGKTTILNAFTWALYGECTPDFEQPERLINDQVWEALGEGEKATVSVKLEFEHERTRYLVERVTADRKAAGGHRQRLEDGRVTLGFTDEAGRNYGYAQRGNPNDGIDRILPKRLHQFFFFNGERIERLVKPDAYEEIGQAIKTLLGLEVVSRAARHLRDARKILETELADVGTPEMRWVTEDISRLEDHQQRLKDDQEQTRRNITSTQDERNAVDERLRSLAEARGLQEERARIEQAIPQAEVRLSQLRDRVNALVDDRGFLAFVPALLDQTLDRFGQLRTRKEIPAPMKRQFVTDLLEGGICICGTALRPGSAEHEHVRDWQQRVGLSEVEASWTRLSAQAEDLQRERERLHDDLADLLRDIASARADRDRLIEQGSEISYKLKELGESEQLENILELEARRERLTREHEDLIRNLGALGEQLKQNESELNQQRHKRERMQAREQRAALAKRRVEVATNAEQVFQQIYELRTDDVRRKLDQRLKEIYRAITYKPYEPRLNEQFQLTLHKSGRVEGLPVPKSTGENLILSLAFVGALAALARQRYVESRAAQDLASLLATAGGVFPVVMDAAFGMLDEQYRREVAKGLPTLAPQVVVLVAKAQGLGAVEEELRARVGRTFVIHYRTPKPDVPPETIEVNGAVHPYVDRADDGIECARLIEI